MPAVPKRKISKRRGATRASHWALKRTQAYVRCDACGAAMLPHHVCPQCGKYHGATVVETKED